MSSINTGLNRDHSDPQDEKVEQILALLQTGDVERIQKKLLLAPFTVHLVCTISNPWIHHLLTGCSRAVARAMLQFTSPHEEATWMCLVLSFTANQSWT